MSNPVSVGDDLVATGPWKLGGFAPGRYMCICLSCGMAHEADKRATQCVYCAAREAASQLAAVTAERDALAKVIDPEDNRPALMARIIMRSIERQIDLEAAEAQLKAAREVVASLNVNDEELLSIRNRCEKDGDIKIWAKMVQRIVDNTRSMRAALNPKAPS